MNRFMFIREDDKAISSERAIEVLGLQKGVEILDSFSGFIVVEADDMQIDAVCEKLRGWNFTAERTYDLKPEIRVERQPPGAAPVGFTARSR